MKEKITFKISDFLLIKDFKDHVIKYNEKDMHYYKKECMFTNEKKAQAYAKKLTKEMGY